MGNNENYDEQHRLRPGAITQDREILRYLRMGESAFMEEEKRKAWAFIEANPRIEMRLIWLRFIEFWAGTPTPFATFRETDSFSWRLLLPCNYLVPFGALLGGVVLAVKKNALTLALIAFPWFSRCSTALHIIRCAIATRSTGGAALMSDWHGRNSAMGSAKPGQCKRRDSFTRCLIEV